MIAYIIITDLIARKLYLFIRRTCNNRTADIMRDIMSFEYNYLQYYASDRNIIITCDVGIGRRRRTNNILKMLFARRATMSLENAPRRRIYDELFMMSIYTFFASYKLLFLNAYIPPTTIVGGRLADDNNNSN